MVPDCGMVSDEKPIKPLDSSNSFDSLNLPFLFRDSDTRLMQFLLGIKPKPFISDKHSKARSGSSVLAREVVTSEKRSADGTYPASIIMRKTSSNRSLHGVLAESCARMNATKTARPGSWFRDRQVTIRFSACLSFRFDASKYTRDASVSDDGQLF